MCLLPFNCISNDLANRPEEGCLRATLLTCTRVCNEFKNESYAIFGWRSSGIRFKMCSLQMVRHFHFIGQKIASLGARLGHFFPLRMSLDGIYQALCLLHEAPSCQFFSFCVNMSGEYRSKLFLPSSFLSCSSLPAFILAFSRRILLLKGLLLWLLSSPQVVGYRFFVPWVCNSFLTEMEARIPAAPPRRTDEFIRVPSGAKTWQSARGSDQNCVYCDIYSSSSLPFRK